MTRSVLALAAAALLGAPAASAAPIAGTGCPAFPASSWWHADVSRLPVHPRSASWLSHMSADRDLHPDFGPGGGSVPYGIPITVVARGHPLVPVRFDYRSESDRGPYPLGPDTRIEGGSDRHAVVVQRGTCRLYETFATRRAGSAWSARSGAIWSLRSNRLRPRGQTSADAAGLPILPGLLRPDEVRRGRVDHAIRFTTDVTDDAFVWPARHAAGAVDDPAYPPMGARLRLKASYRPPAGLSRGTRAVLRAMRRHGLVLADNGSPWFISGAASTRWPARLIAELKRVPAGAFEAVDASSQRVTTDSGRAR